MKNIILRTNAIPVYGFLSEIAKRLSNDKTMPKKKILDCGAGGSVPPLSLFHRHGFEGWGIDSSEEQLTKARQFCDEQGIELQLCQGDMRHIPFEDETFDFVYEHYSMCHLRKKDTALAVHEMYRVLKRGGLCFLGVISTDSWPQSFYGLEKESGEFWTSEAGNDRIVHSMFSDQEADELVSGWEILIKEKRIKYLRDAVEEMSLKEWTNLYEEVSDRYSMDDWCEKYSSRANMAVYAHLYFVLRKS